jgi:DNA (cytosine-5)-methyltransferase 1
VREAARIQTFPDSFKFLYKNVVDGYKMIGNAVPVEFAKRLALKIEDDLLNNVGKQANNKRRGELRSFLTN